MTQNNKSQTMVLEFLHVISLIPYGKVATYGQIARLSGLAKHARYVGFTLKNIDNDAVIPWHRVINSQGKISLRKENERGENLQLLKLLDEGVLVVNGKIDLKKYRWNL